MADFSPLLVRPLPFVRAYALERYAATQAGDILDRKLVALSVNYGGAPQITNISPPAGATLTSASPVQFDVLDEATPLPLVAVFCRQGAAYEVVHDGLASNPRFSVQRLAIDGGYRFVVSAVGGWTAAPQFVVRAVDLGGQLG